MKYYFYKLIPPRLTFPGDITPEERELMRSHSVYWVGQIKQGKALVVGPVADPKGAFGVGIIRLEDGSDPAALVNNDPAILANNGFTWEIHPMPNLLAADGV